MLRFVLASGEAEGRKSELVLDPSQRLPGRGAYCHGTVACLTGKRTAGSMMHTLSKAGVLKVPGGGTINVAQAVRRAGERLASGEYPYPVSSAVRELIERVIQEFGGKETGASEAGGRGSKPVRRGQVRL